MVRVLREYDKIKAIEVFVNMSFQERLKKLRNDNKLSQIEMAKQLHISNSTISSYERGDIAPSIEALKSIAKHFDVSTDYLLCLSDLPYPLSSTTELRLPENTTKEQYKAIQLFASEVLKWDIRQKED
ncbi:MAG: helix-turn-helix domain-containing protein [Oscillospiraceae bacterium]|nr:helix-turn-helix domain-containing protein [Oscillospiraceae bacterium]